MIEHPYMYLDSLDHDVSLTNVYMYMYLRHFFTLNHWWPLLIVSIKWQAAHQNLLFDQSESLFPFKDK